MNPLKNKYAGEKKIHAESDFFYQLLFVFLEKLFWTNLVLNTHCSQMKENLISKQQINLYYLKTRIFWSFFLIPDEFYLYWLFSLSDIKLQIVKPRFICILPISLQKSIKMLQLFLESGGHLFLQPKPGWKYCGLLFSG